MPGTFAALDQNLPRFTGGESLENRVRLLQDYQYQLLEQLRYILSHLDMRNFNMTEINNWAGTITDPIYGRIEDAEGNLTELTVTAKGIAARVSDAEGNISSLQMTATSLSSQIQDANGNISALQQTATAIQTTVSNQAGQISTLTQTAAGLQTTVSDQAGQISSLTQTAAGLQATVSNQAGQISAVTQTVNGLTISVVGPFGQSETKINGGSVYTENLYLDRLYGSQVYLKDTSGANAAVFYLTGASSYAGQKAVLQSGAIELQSMYGDTYISSGQGFAATSLQITNRGLIQVAGQMIPEGDSMYSLGSYSYRWSDIYAANNQIVTSDRENKKDIAYDLSVYNAFFDALRPVSYRLKDGQSGRTHLGLIAQDVEQAMEDCGLTDMDFAGLIRSPRKDGGYDYALRYGEFIAMLIREVQGLKKENQEIRERLGIDLAAGVMIAQ